MVSESSDGEPALFVLLEGECMEYVEQVELGMDAQSRRLYAGDVFGIESIIVPRASACRVAAVEAGRTIELSRTVIEHLFEESAFFARNVARFMASRLHRIQDMVNGIRFVHLKSYPNVRAIMHLLPRRIASASRSLVVEHEGDRVTVAMVNPSDIRARSFVEDVLADYQVQFVAISEDDFEQLGRKLLGERIESRSDNTPFDKLQFQNSDGELGPLAGSHEDDILSRLLTLALRRGASDIHFEPYHGHARVRLRVDGRMVVVDEAITASVYRQLIARIKVVFRTRYDQDSSPLGRSVPGTGRQPSD